MNEVFGLIKTLVDAHTMGVYAAASLLKECGYQVLIAPPRVEKALESLESDESQKVILSWIADNKINHIGISYRLDPVDAVNTVGKLVTFLKKNQYYESESAIVKSIYFAGLKPACEAIEQEYSGRICTLQGGETTEESLKKMGISEDEIPEHMVKGCRYDKKIAAFGAEIIKGSSYLDELPLKRNSYPEFGTTNDTLILRLDHNFLGNFQPLIRAHSGPYSPDMTRQECLAQYRDWCRELAAAGFLDILSIGSSQLSQSNFGENWDNKMNGGGVPVNSEQEYFDIYEAARPMLVRTYSATKNVRNMAEMYERSIHIAWHALSLWWFDELDGRGPNSLYQNLKEHIETIHYIAQIGGTFEANVSHHFAFRGCDDVSYILSAVLSAKLAKKCGIKCFVLQNMLNTPRSTWGVQDLAKSRALLKLVKELEDDSFRVVLQTRAGLDYFKPDIETAKMQLAGVTAMMDDIDPYNQLSPEIIHVVSYSEALFLATPQVLNDSIKITRAALREYRRTKRERGIIEEAEEQITNREERLEKDTREVLKAMENNITDLYSPYGFYLAFVAGWLPVPQLWSESTEFLMAKNWQVEMKNGGYELCENGVILTTETRISRCIANTLQAQYIWKSKYGKRA